MRNDVLLRGLVLGLAVFVGAVGCADDGDQTPGFTPKTGQTPRGTEQVAYPAGPYGIAVGSTVPNYEFAGFVNAMESTASMQAISLADFYNPSGSDVYSETSQYGAGKPKPKALLVILSAGWCEPCKQEAATVLPGKYADLHPQGGEFLLTLADGAQYGVTAVGKDLYNWTMKFDVSYPAVIDPASQMSAITSQDAFPANVMIRTKDMKIMRSFTSAPDASDWAYFQKIIDDVLP